MTLPRPCAPTHHPFGFDIFRIEQARIAEITAFEIKDFPRFGLPTELLPEPA